jgi:carboxymethylenebutenolidase
MSLLLDIQVKIQTSSVYKEGVVFDSDNRVGVCPGSLTGDIRNTSKCLVVIQEWWGMNEQIKQQAAHISSQGTFVTLVPDLYRGRVAKDVSGAIHITRNLDNPGAVEDIQGAARYLLSLGCKKVGVTGFCMGGSLSLATAALVPEISAAAPFYGIPPDSLANVSTIRVPVQCHFGSNDTSNTANPTKYNELRQKLDAGGVEYVLYEYQAGHSFTNPHSPNYNEAIAKLSTKRMIDFMNLKLS